MQFIKIYLTSASRLSINIINTINKNLIISYKTLYSIKYFFDEQALY